MFNHVHQVALVEKPFDLACALLRFYEILPDELQLVDLVPEGDFL